MRARGCVLGLTVENQHPEFSGQNSEMMVAGLANGERGLVFGVYGAGFQVQDSGVGLGVWLC